MYKIKRQIFLFLARAKAQRRLATNRRGQTLVEYALIIAVISIVAIGVLVNLGQNLKSIYSTIDSQVARAPGGVNYQGP